MLCLVQAERGLPVNLCHDASGHVQDPRSCDPGFQDLADKHGRTEYDVVVTPAGLLN